MQPTPAVSKDRRTRPGWALVSVIALALAGANMPYPSAAALAKREPNPVSRLTQPPASASPVAPDQTPDALRRARAEAGEIEAAPGPFAPVPSAPVADQTNLTLQPRATLTVTNGDDMGPGSLRDTIVAAAPGDMIVFQAGVTTVMLTTAELVINKNLTIDGGVGGVTVTRMAGSPSFRIFNLATGFSLTLNRLTISNGSVPGGFGAGILVTSPANLTVTGCTFSGNSGNQGGAIRQSSSPSGMLIIDSCTFESNTATAAGGGVHCSVPTTITNSTFVGNTATNAAGGLFIVTGITGTVTNCTFSGNAITGTTGGFGGGGLCVSSATVTVTNSTFTGNRDPQATSSGGGIRVSSGTVTLTNVLVAGNFQGVAPDMTPNDIRGTITGGSSNNLVGINSNLTGISNGSNGNQIGVGTPIDPMLGILAPNGGPTQTHALLAGSPAINTGTTTGAPALDQRGLTRDAMPDIGAFEFGVSAAQPGLFVADTLNNRIQKFGGSPTPAWSVIATTPFTLTGPKAVTASSDGGRIFVADTGANRILRSTNGGTNWAEFATGLTGPQGLALDSGGNLYVSNTGAGTVLRYDGNTGTLPAAPTATIYTLGSAVSQTQSPRGLALDATFTLFVADWGTTFGSSGRILRVTSANTTPGTYTQVAGYGTSSVPLMQVRNPESVAVDGSGNLYVADGGNNRILRRAGGTSGPGTVLCSLSASLTSPPLGQVRGPEGISIVDAALLGGTMGQAALVVSDTQNNRIQGSLTTTSGTGYFLVGSPNGNGTGTGQFRTPGKIR